MGGAGPRERGVSLHREQLMGGAGPGERGVSLHRERHIFDWNNCIFLVQNPSVIAQVNTSAQPLLGNRHLYASKVVHVWTDISTCLVGVVSDSEHNHND